MQDSSTEFRPKHDGMTIINLEKLVATFAPEMNQHVVLACGHTITEHIEQGGCRK